MVLIKCPKCNHTVLSAASKCPSCQHIMDPEQRDVIRVDRRPGAWVVLSCVAVAGLLGLVVWRAQAEGLFAGEPRPQLTQPTAVSDFSRGPGQHDSATSLGAGMESAPQPKGERRQEARAAISPRWQPAQGAPARAETLWTETWVNVRERPGTKSTVVKVLTPGQAVDVLHPERRWSLVYVDGQELGYLSVALLTEQPPDP